MLAEGYWILLACTNTILLIHFCIAIQQLCITDYILDKPRMRRTILVSVNIFMWITLNCLVYLSSLYPDATLLSMKINILSILVEAVCLLLGFHTFILLISYIINTVYTSTSIHAPKWFKYFANTLETIDFLSVLICFPIYVISNDDKYIYQYYIVLMSLVFTKGVFIIMLLLRPIRMLNEIQIVSNQVASGKFYLKVALSVALFCCIMAISDILYNIQALYHFIDIECDFVLSTAILHSVIVIIFAFCLILWIYKPKFCCVIPEDSVCDIYVYQWCAVDMDDCHDVYYGGSKNKKGPMLLHESTATSINTNNTNKIATVTTLNRSPNVSILNNKQIDASPNIFDK